MDSPADRCSTGKRKQKKSHLGKKKIKGQLPVVDENVEGRQELKACVSKDKMMKEVTGEMDVDGMLGSGDSTRNSDEQQSEAVKEMSSSISQGEVNENEKRIILMCHQCHRNDKSGVVNCSACGRKRYCYECIAKWYPVKTRQDIENTCPFCCGNCNCKSCLRTSVVLKPFDEIADNSVKLQMLQYLLYKTLPVVRHIHEEQCSELAVETSIRGAPMRDINVARIKLSKKENLCCVNCKTSIVNFYRSCPNSVCTYHLCLSCCRELRQGYQPGGNQAHISHQKFVERDSQLTDSKGNIMSQRRIYGWERQESTATDNPKVNIPSQLPDWKANIDGSIPCPPKGRGGCGNCVLGLRRTFKADWVTKLLNKSKYITGDYLPPDYYEGCSSCQSTGFEVNKDTMPEVRQTAFREENHDNFLYCSNALDAADDNLEHFQKHWIRGEPVIVRNVLNKTSGLSWEPMVMWRAFRERGQYVKFKEDTNSVFAIDCLDSHQVKINSYQFFKGCLEGRSHKSGWPEILKLQNLPSSTSFDEHFPRHMADLKAALPFRHYTNPDLGFLNLAARLPLYSSKPDLGPRINITYGFSEELNRGDAVTKLHCDVSDVVNVLTYTGKVEIKPQQHNRIRALQKIHATEDLEELYGGKSEGEPRLGETADPARDSEPIGVDTGGAVWDIFRKQDVPKLIEYLEKHKNEFRNVYNLPVKSVIHPVHDQNLFLNQRHRRQLKDEYGIEPWTFKQHLGEAVFVPAGCPHQVRNRQSCINVAVNFVSPENVEECIRLTEEFRILPLNHKAKGDILEVKKMTLYAVSSAVREAEHLMSKLDSFKIVGSGKQSMMPRELDGENENISDSDDEKENLSDSDHKKENTSASHDEKKNISDSDYEKEILSVSDQKKENTTSDLQDEKQNTSNSEDEKEITVDFDNEKGSAKWKDENTKLFLHMLIDKVRASVVKKELVDKCAWDDVAFDLKQQSGLVYSSEVLKKEYNRLKSNWSLWNMLVSKDTGLEWDDERETIVAPHHGWTLRSQDNEDFKRFRAADLLFEDELKMLFSGATDTKSELATGQSLEENDSDCCVPTIPAQINVVDIHKEKSSTNLPEACASGSSEKRSTKKAQTSKMCAVENVNFTLGESQEENNFNDFVGDDCYTHEAEDISKEEAGQEARVSTIPTFSDSGSGGKKKFDTHVNSLEGGMRQKEITNCPVNKEDGTS